METSGTLNLKFYNGTVNPEGSIFGNVGDQYFQNDNGTGRNWKKKYGATRLDGWVEMVDSESGAGVNIFNSNGFLEDETLRLFLYNAAESGLYLGGEGDGQFFLFGTTTPAGIAELISTNDLTRFKTYDAGSTTTYGVIEATGTSTEPLAPGVRVSRTDEVNFDFGYTAFDDKTNDKLISNLYAYNIVEGSDAWAIAGMIDYSAFPALTGNITGHIHTDPADTTSTINGWAASSNTAPADTEYASIYARATDNLGDGTSGDVVRVGDAGVRFYTNGSIIFGGVSASATSTAFTFYNESTAGGMTLNAQTANNFLRLNNTQLRQATGTTVAAANDLTLAVNGNLYVITGAGTINGILANSSYDGTEMTLIFTGGATVAHNTAASAGFPSVLLAGGVSFVTTNPSTLKIGYEHSTAKWYEISRTVNHA